MATTDPPAARGGARPSHPPDHAATAPRADALWPDLSGLPQPFQELVALIGWPGVWAVCETLVGPKCGYAYLPGSERITRAMEYSAIASVARSTGASATDLAGRFDVPRTNVRRLLARLEAERRE